jgi:hypothetical protein
MRRGSERSWSASHSSPERPLKPLAIESLVSEMMLLISAVSYFSPTRTTWP